LVALAVCNTYKWNERGSDARGVLFKVLGFDQSRRKWHTFISRIFSPWASIFAVKTSAIGEVGNETDY
jgi:hypothetical protein